MAAIPGTSAIRLCRPSGPGTDRPDPDVAGRRRELRTSHATSPAGSAACLFPGPIRQE